jgi:hypothetical protein
MRDKYLICAICVIVDKVAQCSGTFIHRLHIKVEVFGLLWPGKLKRLKAVNCRPVSGQRECPPIFEANISELEGGAVGSRNQ